MGMMDFFTMEASDYLERLDVLVSSSENPEPADFVRLSRQLKGSAIMAGHDRIAGVANGLEALSRAFADGRVPWEEPTRQLAIRAVDDLKLLVRAVPDWDGSDDTRAQKITTELDRFSGRATVPRRVVPSELDPGTRAFIAREGASVGSALDQAARSLNVNPNAFEPLDAVLRAMQPLRGIASLSDLPPLPDLFEGIERAIQEVRRRKDLHTNSSALFDAAARAVSAAAREIAVDGAANPDSDGAKEFARRLGSLLDAETDIVPIETLYHSDDGPHVVQKGQDTQLGRVELVSHLEYLRHAADDIERAESDTQRELRARTLIPTLRTLSTAAGGPLATAAAAFARAARDAINRGVAVKEPSKFASSLREASATLSEAAHANRSQPSNRLTHVITTLRELGEEPAAEREGPTLEIIPSTIRKEAGSATKPAEGPPADAESADGPSIEGTDLAAGLMKYLDLIERVGIEDAQLSELLAGPAEFEAAPPVPASEDESVEPRIRKEVPAGTRSVIRISSEPTMEMEPVRIPVARPSAPAQVEEEAEHLVPITEFCYSGPAALERVVSLRSQVRMALDNDEPRDTLQEILEEIFDLVQLGLERPQ
jgi:chemotaxis protein histidine kinase CheA